MTDRVDTYIRGNSVTTINSPSDAAGDYTTLGTWGILSNAGYEVSSQSQGVAYVETNVSDLTVSANIGLAAFNDVGVICRASGTTTYLLATWTTGTGWRVWEDTAGSFVQKGSTTSGTMNSGDTMSFLANGTGTNGIILSNNGTPKVTTTSSFNSTATGAGIRSHADITSSFTAFSTVAVASSGFFVQYSLINQAVSRAATR